LDINSEVKRGVPFESDLGFKNHNNNYIEKALSIRNKESIKQKSSSKRVNNLVVQHSGDDMLSDCPPV
jgi:hypothetical protein